MYDFGSSDNHGNSITTNSLFTDQPIALSCTFWMNIATVPASATRLLVGNGNFATGTAGWYIELLAAGPAIRMSIGDGVFNAAVPSSTSLSTATMYFIGVSWDGTNVTYYLDGVADGTQALNFTSTTASPFKIGGNAPTTSTFGAAVDIGHVMWWASALDAAEHAAIYGGVIPDLQPILWFPGWTSPGIEIMAQASQTANGTVGAIEDDFSTWIMPQNNDSYMFSDEFVPNPFAGGGGGLYMNRGLYTDIT